MVSVIIPVYNEEKTITSCLLTLKNQSIKNFEIITVDDGSTDNSKAKIKYTESNAKIDNLTLVTQKHLGPAIARNLGAKYAKGDILVFADADMSFDRQFIARLIDPIIRKKAVGTFSKEELLLNKSNKLAVCWNINRYFINGWKLNKEMFYRILPSSYPNQQLVFRAISKKEFEKVGGFDNIGYTDDWSLGRKLNKKSSAAPGARFYHQNPATLSEIFYQCLWISRNEFISGTFFRKILNLVRYSLPISLFLAVYISSKTKIIEFIFFKILYDSCIFIGIVSTFFSSNKIK